mmetsp:Transcript_34384/g.108320  ORF Transcript_34384/g.108320 Transcript_34384/m.108320 type:complete len:248 (-) Transcript_34384:918-1661(-)
MAFVFSAGGDAARSGERSTRVGLVRSVGGPLAWFLPMFGSGRLQERQVSFCFPATTLSSSSGFMLASAPASLRSSPLSTFSRASSSSCSLRAVSRAIRVSCVWMPVMASSRSLLSTLPTRSARSASIFSAASPSSAATSTSSAGSVLVDLRLINASSSSKRKSRMTSFLAFPMASVSRSSKAALMASVFGPSASWFLSVSTSPTTSFTWRTSLYSVSIARAFTNFVSRSSIVSVRTSILPTSARLAK